MQRQEQTQAIQPSSTRNPYRTPKLVRHGRLASIVQGGVESATNNESASIFFSDI